MYQIITDGSWDMGTDRAKALDGEVVPYYVTMDGATYLKEIEELNVRDFYTFMVNNPTVYPKTSQPTVQDYITAFQKYACQGIDIICFTLSAKFSGSHNAAQNARNMVLGNYPDVRITVIDSTLATLMQGLMIQEIVRYQRSGASYDELISRALAIIPTCRIFFYGYNIQEGEALRTEVINKLKQRWPDYDPAVDIGQIGATIGVHTGPHPLGLGLCEKILLMEDDLRQIRLTDNFSDWKNMSW